MIRGRSMMQHGNAPVCAHVCASMVSHTSCNAHVMVSCGACVQRPHAASRRETSLSPESPRRAAGPLTPQEQTQQAAQALQRRTATSPLRAQEQAQQAAQAQAAARKPPQAQPR